MAENQDQEANPQGLQDPTYVQVTANLDAPGEILVIREDLGMTTYHPPTHPGSCVCFGVYQVSHPRGKCLGSCIDFLFSASDGKD